MIRELAPVNGLRQFVLLHDVDHPVGYTRAGDVETYVSQMRHPGGLGSIVLWCWTRGGGHFTDGRCEHTDAVQAFMAGQEGR